MSDLIGSLELLDVARGSYGFSAVAHGLFALYLMLAWRGGRPGALLFSAVLAGGLWATATYLALGSGRAPSSLLAALLDAARIGAWFGFLNVLLHSAKADRPLLRSACIAVVAMIAASSLGGAIFAESDVGVAHLAVRGALLFNLLAAVMGLVLIEQLFRTLPADGRWGFKPMSLGLVAAFAFDIYLYAEGLLFQHLDEAAWAVRGFAHAATLPLVALTVSRNPDWKIRISVSRQVVFHSSALLGAGAYLLLVAGAGYYLQLFGGDWGRAFQIALVFAALVVLLVVAVSGSLRARMRVWLSKHLFAYKYDYRNEWLGFTRALAAASGEHSPEEAVVKALADLVESPGGGIWLNDGHGDLVLKARLNMPDCAVREPLHGRFSEFLQESAWIVNLAEYRSRQSVYQGLSLPPWLSRLEGAWLIVPLTSGGGLVGFVILLSPRTSIEVDWEVLDLLKTAQQQAATYLSQLQSQEALLEAKKFDAFNRMSAFVVHDLKNLVAQLSLLIRNAERHRFNPEFQKDMLETVAHVEGRMRALMGQLIEKTPIDQRKPVDLSEIVARIVDARASALPVPRVVRSVPVSVLAHADRLERILGHIVQNAMDATPADGKVEICVTRCDDATAEVSVSDTGSGMSAEFLRDELFKPFRSTKTSGMGIGAYESRQYVKEIGGSIGVSSEPGVGTEMRVRLPVCAASADAVVDKTTG